MIVLLPLRGRYITKTYSQLKSPFLSSHQLSNLRQRGSLPLRHRHFFDTVGSHHVGRRPLRFQEACRTDVPDPDRRGTWLGFYLASNENALTIRQVNDNLTFKGNLGAGPDEIKQLMAMEETECGVKFADDAAEKLKTGKSWLVAACAFVVKAWNR